MHVGGGEDVAGKSRRERKINEAVALLKGGWASLVLTVTRLRYGRLRAESSILSSKSS